MGYLPEAMRNYLARLGWGHGDDEVFTDDQAIAWFDVADVVSAPARLDWAKLNFINGQYIRAADDDRLTRLTADVHRGRGVRVDESTLARAVPLVKEAAKTMLELADLTLFVLKSRPLDLDDKTLALLTDETRARLARLREHLAEEGDWTHAALNQRLRDFATSEGVGLGKFGPALRGVLSGGAAAPDLASALSALDRDESLHRIDEALSRSRQDAIRQSK
jgi:glutamyl-tRNA synthetase